MVFKFVFSDKFRAISTFKKKKIFFKTLRGLNNLIFPTNTLTYLKNASTSPAKYLLFKLQFVGNSFYQNVIRIKTL